MIKGIFENTIHMGQVHVDEYCEYWTQMFFSCFPVYQSSISYVECIDPKENSISYIASVRI